MVVDGDIVAWCPWATPEPFVVRIAPRVDIGGFAILAPTVLEALARTLGRVLAALNALLDAPPYNVVLYVDAARGDDARRWRVEVVPRLASGGGFERGSGATTNASDPRAEAEVLRAAIGLSGTSRAESGLHST